MPDGTFRAAHPRAVVMRRLGYRGLALIALGFNWVAYGLQMIALGPQAVDPDQAILHELIPWSVRLWLWLGTGTLALVLALAHRAVQWVAFFCALIMPVERLGSHAWSWWAWLVPGEPGGASDAGPLTLRWACIAFLVLLMSRWREGSDQRIAQTRQEA